MRWRTNKSKVAMVFGVVLALALGGAACGSSSASGGGKVQLSLVAYSTPQEAYAQIIKAYQSTPEGKNVTFRKSFGASGDQSRAVASGLTATSSPSP